MRTIVAIIFAISLIFASLAISASAMGGNAPADMVFVKGGCFTMGSDAGLDNEKPAHEVCLSDFLMDAKEVTQDEFKSVMGFNPSNFVNGINPVEMVTWNQADTYCKKSGKRLPTEAEWEYAARGGGKDRTFPGFDKESRLKDYAWGDFNSPEHMTSPTAKKKPNELGLYDMAGNVSEWTADWFSETYYASSPKDNPTGPAEGALKVVRGGSWCDTDINMFKTTHRYTWSPTRVEYDIGIRCVKSP